MPLGSKTLIEILNLTLAYLIAPNLATSVSAFTNIENFEPKETDTYQKSILYTKLAEKLSTEA